MTYSLSMREVRFIHPRTLRQKTRVWAHSLSERWKDILPTETALYVVEFVYRHYEYEAKERIDRQEHEDYIAREVDWTVQLGKYGENDKVNHRGFWVRDYHLFYKVKMWYHDLDTLCDYMGFDPVP